MGCLAIRSGAGCAAILTAYAGGAAPTPSPLKLPECKLAHYHGEYYPASQQRIGAEGEVLVDFLIDARGSVHDARVLASSPNADAFEKTSVGLVEHEICSVPKDWTQIGGPEHRFRVWIFFSLVSNVRAATAAPTASELRVDGVMTVDGTGIPAPRRSE